MHKFRHVKSETWHIKSKALLRAEQEDSARCCDLGRGLLLRGRGLVMPCSSRSSCCFLRRYSCLISSLRDFSSSLRTRSSSAFCLTQWHQMYLQQPFYSIYLKTHWIDRYWYLASSRLISDSASSCCLRIRVSSALRCSLRRNAALFLASSSSAFWSSCIQKWKMGDIGFNFK